MIPARLSDIARFMTPLLTTGEKVSLIISENWNTMMRSYFAGLPCSIGILPIPFLEGTRRGGQRSGPVPVESTSGDLIAKALILLAGRGRKSWSKWEEAGQRLGSTTQPFPESWRIFVDPLRLKYEYVVRFRWRRRSRSKLQMLDRARMGQWICFPRRSNVFY